MHHRLTASSLVSLVTLATCLGWPGQAAAEDPCARATAAASVQAVSRARAPGAQCGERGRFAPAAPVTWSPRLEALARDQAQWMVEYGMLIHTGRGGETLGQRATAAGYRFARIAENLAQGQDSLDAALDAWTKSDGHCANLFDPAVNEMALACAPGADGRAMWVLMLGRPL
jgi:uncharacterized protein YkwD